MRSGANTDLKVGLTVLIGLALLLFGIGWAKGWHFRSDQHLLYARFPTAGGIEKGDPVFIRGIKHGTVSDIISIPGKDVDITMEIDQAGMGEWQILKTVTVPASGYAYELFDADVPGE